MITPIDNGPVPVTVLSEPQAKRDSVTVTTVTSADDTFAELLSRGLRITITPEGRLSVRPARLVDGALADLIRTNRAGLIAIAARGEPDPIRRGLLTGDLHGWHLERDGDDLIEVEGLADWHADVIGINEEGDR